MRKLAAALFATWLVIFQPAMVKATTYTAVIYSFTYINPRAGGWSDFCYKSGLVNPIQNYGFVWNQLGGPPDTCHNQDKPANPASIGVLVRGYVDGVFCGEFGYSTNSQWTAAWQVWATLCSNPSGLQFFRTTTKGEGLEDDHPFPWRYLYTDDLTSGSEKH